MTEQDKQLLLKDLCARVLYKPKVKVLHVWNEEKEIEEDIVDTVYCVLPEGYINTETIDSDIPLNDNVILYLRPMSSMTEKEKKELLNLLFDKEAKYFYIDEEGTIDGKTFDLMKDGLNYPTFCPVNIVLYTDWLNKHYFDYRGLIGKSLAIVAPEGMYKTE